MSPMGPGTKNKCAGEAQQQLTQPTNHSIKPYNWNTDNKVVNLWYLHIKQTEHHIQNKNQDNG